MAGVEGPPDSAVRAVVQGHVQGVGFRYATTHRAAELGLACEAQNLPDGTVLVTARGAAADVDALVNWLRSGRTPGRVTGVDAQPV